ncbi:Peptidyl-prolyl isomerase cwc27 [Mycoemilia scoparia]|uniref:Peptidyl-prolyl isomerase CWC27 n=1 Tax=Mycoemilia scoparia TaxID=417184 RepID=A0A9W8DP47_9FUNG|nr:Peptidyl-prolyl isomerase cwc27 [Mycoemilia scoparia]
MSNVYQLEPPTKGKVIICTTAGDIEIELWSKEAPKACRNFIQLALEGYYENTIFHRVVPGFIVQSGDPTGTGAGGESIYGEPFADEFHSRLRFTRRGLLAMANAGADDNGSQFFFTLGPAQELQKKHTIFGTIVGDTLFNALKIGEGVIDQETERPEHPHKITRIRVVDNPFDDIVPRITAEERRLMAQKKKSSKKNKIKTTKNKSLLSFGGDEAENDDDSHSLLKKGVKIKSSHDIPTKTKAPRKRGAEENSGAVKDGEAKKPHIEQTQDSFVTSKENSADDVDVDTGDDNEDIDEVMRNKVLAKKAGYLGAQPKTNRNLTTAQEIDVLEKEIAAIDSTKTTSPTQKAKAENHPKKPTSILQAELEKYTRKNGKGTMKGKASKKQKAANEQDLINKLSGFKGKLKQMQSKDRKAHSKSATTSTGQDKADESKTCKLHGLLVCETCKNSKINNGDQSECDVDEQDSANWMGHKLSFKDEKLNSNSEYAPKVEDYEVIDPRSKERQIRESLREKKRDRFETKSRRH